MMSDRTEAWKRFAEENGYAVGDGMELEEAEQIRAYWEGELEVAVETRDQLALEMQRLQVGIEQNQKNLEHCRFLHDGAAKAIIYRLRSRMEPINLGKMDAELNDPFDDDEDD